MNDVLLDTCAAIWFSDGEKLRREAAVEFEAAAEGVRRIYVSPISAWEVGLLVSRGRYLARVEITRWFDHFVAEGGFAVADLSPRLLASSSFLPGKPPTDPGDRIIITTAREHGFRVMTRDRKILDYAEQGHVQVIAC
jgi:PIN domain nuclease of toxin-antitoxin system